MSTGPEELSLETIAPEDADLIDLRYEGVDLPLDENADPTQVDLACGEHLGVVSLEGGYDDESFVDLHVLGEVFRGESAYATAVRNGFVGTEAQWLETLVGPESPNAAVALAAQLAAEQAADRAEAAETGASISETASADHAAAASTARGQAEAYSDSASAYAQASLDFQTQAETSAGEALAYRNQAAQSSTDADSAAARAETAEGVSVTMRNQAQGFSEASAASSQSAETYMDESRVEAQAARDAHLLAETSRENSLAHSQASYDSAQEALARSTEAGEYASAALTSRLAAEAARDDTDVAAAAVIIDRDIVIARADEAGEYAEAAESHRASALTSAGAASVSAENSAISETNAESSRVAAEAARDIAVASSGDAADALTATISYRDQAEIFSDSAGDSATAAATARVAAESARDTANGAASAAATSASSASSSQTAAASSASAASTSATNAATSAGAASTSATNASNSATTASGHAATASTQATNAANSATAAGGSATAASGSASSAATSATNAGNSATAANSSAISAASSFVAANVAAAMQFPDRYDGTTGAYFAGFPLGSPSTIPPKSSNATQAGYGPVYDTTGEGGADDFSTVGVLPATPGRIYKAEVEFQRTASTGTPDTNTAMGLVFRTMEADFSTDTGYMGEARVALTGSVQTLSYMASDTVSGPGVYNWPSGTVWLRPYVRQYFGSLAAQTIRIRRLTVTDVTEQQAALTSATAAATSASAASTSATNAGTSATAAATSATNASTSAGSAGTSATNAANSATTATTQANNASTSASTAATHATNAGNSASAAGTSATTAGTHATNAGNSATAANTSAVNAASSFTSTRLTAANLLPKDFVNDGLMWFQSYGGLPSAVTPIGANAAPRVTFPSVSGIGKVLQLSMFGGDYNDVSPIGWFRPVAGKTYRFSMRVRASVWYSGPRVEMLWLTHSADGTYVNSGYIGQNSGVALTAPTSGPTAEHPYATTWEVLTGTITGDVLLASAVSVAYCRPMIRGRTGGNEVNQYHIEYLSVEDITESQSALTQANAAATSASSASTSAGAAGVSATSAATQATNAGVSAGNAASSASTAATQASNASASAASASSSATVAANLYGATANLLQKSQFFAEDYPGTPAPWTGGVHNGAANVASVWFDGSWSPPGERSLAAYDTVPVHTADGYYDFYSEAVPWEGAKRGCASVYSGIHRTGGRLIVAMLDGGFNVLAFADPNDAAARNLEEAGGGVRLQDFKRLSVFFTPPSTCVYIRLLLRKYSTNAGQSSSYAFWARPMVSEATATQTTPPPWAPANLSAQQSALAASVSTVQDAVVDLETQNALARFEVSAATGGGTARMRLVSTTYGTNILLDADKIFFGDNTVFDNAVDVLVTTTGSNSRILAWGAAFGTDGQLTEWEGPSSVTWGNHSRANAYFYRANVAPYVGGSALASGFTVTSSHTSRVGTRVGAGSVTSGTVTLTPAGASGSVTYSWSRVYGDSSITATSGSSAATAFTTTVTAGQEKQALFAWTATDGAGKVQTGTVGVGLIGNA